MGRKKAQAAKKGVQPSVNDRWRDLLTAPERKKSLDKRIFQRESTYRFARLGVASGVAVNCVVRDISEGGVRIKLEEERRLPGAVRLTYVDSGETIFCRVAWQKAKHVGLEFFNQKRRGYKALSD